MAFEITIPRLGWSMEEGTFSGWLKQDGDTIRRGDSLFELEGERATQEIEAVDAVILRIPANSPQRAAWSKLEPTSDISSRKVSCCLSAKHRTQLRSMFDDFTSVSPYHPSEVRRSSTVMKRTFGRDSAACRLATVRNSSALEMRILTA